MEQQKHTDLLDRVLDEDAHVIPEELRRIFIALRQERQHEGERRLALLETLISDHIVACAKNSNDMKTLLEITQAMQGSMKMANWFKKLIVWSASIAGGFYMFWKIWRGQ